LIPVHEWRIEKLRFYLKLTIFEKFMIFDFEIDKKVCFAKASLSCRFSMRKNKKVVFTGKDMVKVYIKFYFAHNFLRHDFVRF